MRESETPALHKGAPPCPLEQVLDVLTAELTTLVLLAVAFCGAVNIIVAAQLAPLLSSIEDLKKDVTELKNGRLL